MLKWRGLSHIRLAKRPGAALLGIVLASLIVLGIFSAVAFNISMSTMRVERWQREHFESQQMHYLARSAIIAVGQRLYALYKTGGATEANIIDRTTSFNVTDSSRSFAASVDMVLSADAGASSILIKATAYNPNSTISNDTKAAMSARYNKTTNQIASWNEED